ncbi:MAG: hypothetical protein DMG75_12765 [Acidobacteria bacterium]|nr:MAG: hypothetical protein DMG75_12765 [Acidobacteriota bacterium]
MTTLFEDGPAAEIVGRRLVGRVLFVLLVLVAALLGATIGLLLVYSTDLPQVEELEHYRPSSITEVYDDHGRVIGSFALQRRVVASYDDYPQVLRDALEIQSRRRRIWQNYYAGLEAWADQQGVGLPFVPDYCDQAYHMFYLLLPSLQDRQALIGHLRSRGILAVFHYLPLHLSEYGRRWGGKDRRNLPWMKPRCCLAYRKLPAFTRL